MGTYDNGDSITNPYVYVYFFRNIIVDILTTFCK